MGEVQVSLKRLGWNPYFDALWQERKEFEWLPARVISQQRGLWRIAGILRNAGGGFRHAACRRRSG